MNLTTIEPALRTLASNITGIALPLCVFENAGRPQSPDGRMVILSWISRAGVGQDGTRWDYAADADPLLEMTPTVQGSRECSLQFAVEITADQRSGYNAAAILETARTRLSRPSSLAALEAVDLALATVGPGTQADYPDVNGRMVSRSLCEISMNAHASESDPDGRTAHITTIGATASIEGASGTDLPVSIQPSLG